MRTAIFLMLSVIFLVGCDRPASQDPDAGDSLVTFNADLEFLRSHGEVRILRDGDGRRVALSDQYQGRVMTSAVSEDGLSFGWINRDFIEAGSTGTAFDNYGGEDRFWLGPEGGQYSLYFPADSEFTLENWQVPAALQESTWPVTQASDSSVTYEQDVSLSNYSGTSFDLQVTRTIRLLPTEALSSILGESVSPGVELVAFESENEVLNTGAKPWTADDGLLSIWILGMFNTFGTSWVVVPFDGPPSDSVITDSYFGEVPAERLAVREGYAVFKADGKYRSKIGVPEEYAQPVLGSYSPDVDALTLVHFDLPEDAARYVNSLWEMQEEPYEGDVVNSYNDGPPGTGGFYELESSSPALALRPGESYTHRHRTMHFIGDEAALDSLARTILGVGIEEIGL